MLRPSLLPGMLTMLAHNLNRNVSDVQLFEQGTVFSGSAERVDERPALALGASGFFGAARSSLLMPSTSMTSRERSKKFWKSLLRAPSTSIPFLPAQELLPAWLGRGVRRRAVADGLTIAWLRSSIRLRRSSASSGKVFMWARFISTGSTGCPFVSPLRRSSRVSSLSNATSLRLRRCGALAIDRRGAGRSAHC